MAITAMAALCHTSCNNINKNPQAPVQEEASALSDSVAEESEPEEEVLKLETIVKQSDGQRNDVTISVQYPVAGPAVLVNSIREYINESFGGNYSGDLTDLANGEDMLKFYYDQRMADLSEYGDGDPNIGRSMQLDSIYMKCQTDDFITFMKFSQYFYAGSAHPGSAQTGITFRKSDGRRIDWSMFTGKYEEGFQRLIKGGLMQYFDVETEKELREQLQVSTEYGTNIPLPNLCPPIFTRHGIQFIYGEYEIASYAAGMPHFTIPYADIKSYMNASAQKLIPKRTD